MDLLTSLIREGLYLCYTIIPNWGMAIVLLTVVIRVVFFAFMVTMPAGVGLYTLVSTVFQLGTQQVISSAV